jgi:4-amino-4-deoxy-L-arabinose transferase-like glycosyltransferase
LETKRVYLLLILSLGGLVFLFNLGQRDLWEPDETRYAVVAREMKGSGNWIVPHLNGAAYAEKPPLFFWLVNLSTFFFGENSEFTNRLPSALAGLFTLLITVLFAERLFNEKAGLFSGLALATCLLFPQVSRWMLLDSLFVLLFVAATLFLYQGFHIEEKRRRGYLLAGLFMGFGVLTKGPIAYLPLLIFLVFGLFQKEVKRFWNRNLLWGVLLSLLIVLLWLVPACWMGGRDYTEKILLERSVARFTEEGKHFHAASLFLYFIRFPGEFIPWFVFFLIALVFGLKRTTEKRREFIFLTVWFVVIFVFFSLSKAKKDTYLMPLYPASAMMVGWLWDTGMSLPKVRKWTGAGLLLSGLVSLILLVVALSGVPQRIYPPAEPYVGLGVAILSLVFAGSGIAWVLFMKRRPSAAFLCIAIAFTLVHLHLSYVLPERLDPQRSMKSFSESILKRMEAGDELKTYFFQSKGLIYYTRKPYIEEVKSKARFFELMNSSQRVFMILHASVFEQLIRETKIQIEPIEQRSVARWNYVLISNR